MSTHPAVASDLQAQRQAQVQHLFRQHYADVFRADGHCVLPELTDQRAYLWASCAFLGGDAALVAKAHAMLTHALGHGRGHFWTSAVASILTHHHDRLECGLRDRLATALAKGLPGEMGQACRGYNDNYPAMAACSTVLGGQYVGDAKAVEAGRETLRSFARLHARRGVLSEHTSPTYSPITLTCLAEIAEHAQDAECRALARDAEQRVWLDLFAHFHPGTGILAGPYSRAYLADLCGHFHNAHTVLWIALGDAVVATPEKVAFPWDGRMLPHGSTPAFVKGHVAWQSLPRYHLPEGFADLALRKRDGCHVRATAEQASYPRNFWSMQRHPTTPTMEFPAGPFAITTWLRRTFALGSASATFLDGNQHAGVHLTYAPSGQATGAHDLATVFSRYLIGDVPTDASAMINDLGRTVTVQDEGRVLAACSPRPTWGSSPSIPDTATTPVTHLRLSLFFTCFHGAEQEVWLGSERMTAWTGQSLASESIFVRDGSIFIAIHPAIGADLGRAAAITVERSGPFGIISLVNYAGTARTFAPEELLTCGNGFHMSVADAADFDGDFAAFRAHHAALTLTDRFVPDDGLRYLDATLDGKRLALALSPMSAGIQYRTINDALVPEPAFAVDGMPAFNR